MKADEMTVEARPVTGTKRFHGVLEVPLPPPGLATKLAIVCPHFHHGTSSALACAKRLRTKLKATPPR